jgi:hypothetical protein
MISYFFQSVVAFRKSMNVLTFLPLQILEARCASGGWCETWYDVSGASGDWLTAIFERSLLIFIFSPLQHQRLSFLPSKREVFLHSPSCNYRLQSKSIPFSFLPIASEPTWRRKDIKQQVGDDLLFRKANSTKLAKHSITMIHVFSYLPKKQQINPLQRPARIPGPWGLPFNACQGHVSQRTKRPELNADQSSPSGAEAKN